MTIHSNRSFTISLRDNLMGNYVCYFAEWTARGRKAAFMSYHSQNISRTLSEGEGGGGTQHSAHVFYQHPHIWLWVSGGRRVIFKTLVTDLPEPLEPYRRYTLTLNVRPDKDTCNMKSVNNSESTYGSTQFYFMEGCKPPLGCSPAITRHPPPPSARTAFAPQPPSVLRLTSAATT